MLGALLLMLLADPPQTAPAPSPQAEAPPPDMPIDREAGRRKPGYQPPLPPPVTQDNPGAVSAPPPEAFPADQIPLPDRWRLIQSLGVVTERWLDPYHQNTLKGDRPIDRAKVKWLPIRGDDWFFSLNLTSDSLFEPRSFPIPVGVQTTERPNSIDVFGDSGSFLLSQTFLAGFSLVKGRTTFKPPEIEYRLTLALNLNYAAVPERRVLFVQPSRPPRRFDNWLGVQEAFIDYHLRDTSDRYDFESIRFGIQPFQVDFRGFLFNDDQLGVRFFGNRDGNRFQFNLAAFWRLEKDTNSGLNNVRAAPRSDWVFVANLYRQDFLIPGLTSQIAVVYNMNRERGDVRIDANGFPVRPALIGNLRGRDYDIVYLGYNADGHIGRLNVTASAYAALGSDRDSIFTGRPAQVRAHFGAAELSYDVNWVRFRLSGLYASGDGDPYDDVEHGFDAINENPIIAGADTSYWIRQSIPFAGGGRAIALSGRNGILNALRSSKEQGQSNFNNPGTALVGLGGDFDLTPRLRLSTNVNHLWFATTATLRALRNEGSIPADIGWDLSAAAIFRPRASQNIVLRLSAATLVPGAGFRDLFASSDRDRAYVSVLANLILSY